MAVICFMRAFKVNREALLLCENCFFKSEVSVLKISAVVGLLNK